MICYWKQKTKNKKLLHRNLLFVTNCGAGEQSFETSHKHNELYFTFRYFLPARNTIRMSFVECNLRCFFQAGGQNSRGIGIVVSVWEKRYEFTWITILRSCGRLRKFILLHMRTKRARGQMRMWHAILDAFKKRILRASNLRVRFSLIFKQHC